MAKMTILAEDLAEVLEAYGDKEVSRKNVNEFYAALEGLLPKTTLGDLIEEFCQAEGFNITNWQGEVLRTNFQQELSDERGSSVAANLKEAEGYSLLRGFTEDDAKVGEAWLIKADGMQVSAIKDEEDWGFVDRTGLITYRPQGEVRLISRMVPDLTVGPSELFSQSDYVNAPIGTVCYVITNLSDEMRAWVKRGDNDWQEPKGQSPWTDDEMAMSSVPRKIARWGSDKKEN